MCDHGRGLDGRTVARGRRTTGTGGKRREKIYDSGGGDGGVAYEARGYKQGWVDRQADGPNQASAILARLYNWKRTSYTGTVAVATSESEILRLKILSGRMQ